MYPQSMFWSKNKKKITIFHQKIIIFTTVKYCCILYGRVFVMRYSNYHKVPKFLDARKLCCNLPKIQTKRPNLRVFCQKDANGIANSEDPDQTAPRGV